MIKYGTNNIGSLYFGSNPIGKAYLGSNLVFSRGSGPSPQPTTNVAYIRGGANGSYIDTGITADSTTRVVVWARNWQPYSESLFGSRTAMQSGEFALTAVSGNQVDMIRMRFGTYSAFANYAISNLYSNYHKYELNGNTFLVDDVVKAQTNSATFSNSVNIHLFGINTGGTHSAMNYPADICACQIYKGGTKVRDFTAVNSPSTGLYDSVSGTLFTNAGSGSFTYGTFNSSAYTPLEYIECDAQQWFDTGLYGSYSLPLITKFRLTNTVARWNSLLGARTNNSAGRYDVSFGDANHANYFVSFGYNNSANDLVTQTNKTNVDLIVTKSNNVFSAYEGETLLKSVTGATGTTFQTTYTLAVGSFNAAGTVNSAEAFYGRIYYIGFGDQMSLVPAKVNSVVGMYDTYNNIFYTSTSGTAFSAGPVL